MNASSRRTAIVIGVLILTQMAGSAVVNFFAEAPLFDGAGFLVNAAAHSNQVAVAVFIAILMEAIWVAIAILAFPIIAGYSTRAALSLVALSILCLTVGVVENAGVMSMVSVSQVYATANPADRAQLEAMRVVVASARNWPHYLGRMSDGLAALFLYIALFRFALVPRAIGAVGMIAVASMLTGLVMPFFGHSVIFPLLAPLGLTQLALSLWLIIRGFSGRVADSRASFHLATAETSTR